MKKDALSQRSRPQPNIRTFDDEYEYSEAFTAEDTELVEVYGSSLPFITAFCIILLILFTMFIIALKLSGGRVESPKEAISNFFMPLRSDYYEIRVDDEDYEANANEKISEFMQDNGYSERLKTSAFNRNTTMYLKQEDGKAYTCPGAYGSTTFYIKPRKADADFTIHIEYDVYGITALDNGSLIKTSEFVCSDNTARKTLDDVDNLLDGHILFFEDRSNGKYSGLLKNGEMTYHTSEHRDDLNSNGEYKVKVYWIWAEYYEQVVNAQADGALFNSSDQQKQMVDYITKNPDEFFCTAEIGEIPSETEITDYNTLSAYYDNGDKLIMENTDYFGFYVHTCAE